MKKQANAILTMADARDEKRLADAIMEASEASTFKPAQPVVPAGLDRRIGVLVRDGRTVFYAFVGSVLVEGSPEHLTLRLDADTAQVAR